MNPEDNPYSPGAGTKPPALLGRDELIEKFRVTVKRAVAGRSTKSMMPIGLRGVGKTVLLNEFSEVAEDAGFEVAFIEASETGDFRTLLALRLRKILLGLRLEGPVPKLTRALSVLKSFSYTLPDGSAVSLEIDPLRGTADTGVLEMDLTDLLVTVGEAMAEKGKGLLLAIDEVQYLSTEELGGLITAIHRTTQIGLPVLLVGAGLPQLPGLAGDAKSYAERLFDFPLIGALRESDARSVIEVPAKRLGVSIESEALNVIVEEAYGYPYFLQEWGFHVWDNAPGSPITVGDVTAARPRVISQLDENFFLVRFDRLTPLERIYLRAMAELGPGPHRSGEIAECLGVKVESVAPRRSGLIKKGMIFSPAHGDTAFTVPLFDEFLKRMIPDWKCARAPQRT